ncbi:MAG TPA: HIT domain-containing protein [Rickettsiales bacterium]|nr:HIT domain-containing protein [Rickettsiales bacterium]
MKGCVLCDMEEQQNRFATMITNDKTKCVYHNPILFETENFYLTIDLHPISDCHYLIVPKMHYTSYSLIPKKYEVELNFLIKLIKEKNDVENFILFEHGSGFINETLVGCGNSVFHAHMHFIGKLKYDSNKILKIMSLSGINLKELSIKTIERNNSLLQIIITNNDKCYNTPYLFLKFNDTECLIMLERDKIKIQSQFFRKMFSEEINGKGCFWNWKDIIEQNDKTVLQERIIKMITRFKVEK